MSRYKDEGSPQREDDEDPSLTSSGDSYPKDELRIINGRSLRYGGKLLCADFPGKQPRMYYEEEDTTTTDSDEEEDLSESDPEDGGSYMEDDCNKDDESSEASLSNLPRKEELSDSATDSDGSDDDSGAVGAAALDVDEDDASDDDDSFRSNSSSTVGVESRGTLPTFDARTPTTALSVFQNSIEESKDVTTKDATMGSDDWSQIDFSKSPVSSVEYNSDEDSAQVSAVSTSDADDYNSDDDASRFDDDDEEVAWFAQKMPRVASNEDHDVVDDDVDDIQESFDDVCSSSIKATADATATTAYSSGNSSPSLPDDDLVELVSDALEFDFWSHDKLKIAASILSSRLRSPRQASIQLPFPTDVSFWIDEMLLALPSSGSCARYLTTHPSRRTRSATIVHDAFNSELSSCRMGLAYVGASNTISLFDDVDDRPTTTRCVYVGSLSDLESRLALAVLGIKRIIAIAFQPIEELWGSDGVRYSTHVIPLEQGASPNDTRMSCIESAAEEVAFAIANEVAPGESVLIACPFGNKYACTVAVLYLVKNQLIDVNCALEVMRQNLPAAQPDVQLLKNLPSTCDVRTKRVLSCQMLSQLALMSSSSMLCSSENPKRIRTSLSTHGSADPQELPYLSTSMSTNGSAADPQELPHLSLGPPVAAISGDYLFDPFEDGDSADGLEEFDGASSVNSLEDYSAVPLLTPPTSPTRFFTYKRCFSNDESTIKHRQSPSSPNSFQKQEELQRTNSPLFNTSSPTKVVHHLPLLNTGLTPRIKGIQVTFNNNTSHNLKIDKF